MSFSRNIPDVVIILKISVSSTLTKTFSGSFWSPVWFLIVRTPSLITNYQKFFDQIWKAVRGEGVYRFYISYMINRLGASLIDCDIFMRDNNFSLNPRYLYLITIRKETYEFYICTNHSKSLNKKILLPDDNRLE